MSNTNISLSTDVSYRSEHVHLHDSTTGNFLARAARGLPKFLQIGNNTVVSTLSTNLDQALNSPGRYTIGSTGVGFGRVGDAIRISLDPDTLRLIHEQAEKKGIATIDAVNDVARQAALGLGTNVVVEERRRLIATSNPNVIEAAGPGKRSPISIKVINVDPRIEHARREQEEREFLDAVYTTPVEARARHGIFATRNRVDSMVVNGKVVDDPEQLSLFDAGSTIQDFLSRSSIALTPDKDGRIVMNYPSQANTDLAVREPNSITDIIEEIPFSEDERRMRLRNDVERVFGIVINNDGEVMTSVKSVQALLEEAKAARQKSLFTIDLSNLKIGSLFKGDLRLLSPEFNKEKSDEPPKSFLSNLKESAVAGAKAGATLTAKALAGVMVASVLLGGAMEIGHRVDSNVPGAKMVATQVAEWVSGSEVKVNADGIEISGKLKPEDMEAVEKAQAKVVFEALGVKGSKEWVEKKRLENGTALLDGKEFVVSPAVVERVSVMIQSELKKSAAAKVTTSVAPSVSIGGP